MKRAIIVHCWGGNPKYAWYPWLQAQLETRGYAVTVPAMPDTDAPRLDKWLPHLQALIGTPDKELVLIGHSIGTVTIMRYLEGLPADQKIGKAILVAGFTDQLGFEELENFFEGRLDYAAIKPKSEQGFVAIQSDNDPFVSVQYGERLKTELDAQLIIKHGAGHMSGPLSDAASCTELPEVLGNLMP